MNSNKLIHYSPRIAVTHILSIALWVASIILVVLGIFALREVLIWGVALVLSAPDRLSQLRAENMVTLSQQCGVVVFGVVALGAIIAISEYFFRNFGKPRLLRTLLIILAFEAALVLPVWALFWRQ